MAVSSRYERGSRESKPREAEVEDEEEEERDLFGESPYEEETKKSEEPRDLDRDRREKKDKKKKKQRDSSSDDGLASLLLLDVTPLGIGVVTGANTVEYVIPRNTTIPCRKTASLRIPCLGEKMVLQVVEGVRALPEETNVLTTLDLPACDVASRSCNITMDIDANGILKVVAEVAGKVCDAVVTNDRGRLSSDDISRMVTEAEKYKAEDARELSRRLSTFPYPGCVPPSTLFLREHPFVKPLSVLLGLGVSLDLLRQCLKMLGADSSLLDRFDTRVSWSTFTATRMEDGLLRKFNHLQSLPFATYSRLADSLQEGCYFELGPSLTGDLGLNL